jgi:hypothetical protein
LRLNLAIEQRRRPVSEEEECGPEPAEPLLLLLVMCESGRVTAGKWVVAIRPAAGAVTPSIPVVVVPTGKEPETGLLQPLVWFMNASPAAGGVPGAANGVALGGSTPSTAIMIGAATCCCCCAGSSAASLREEVRRKRRDAGRPSPTPGAGTGAPPCSPYRGAPPALTGGLGAALPRLAATEGLEAAKPAIPSTLPAAKYGRWGPGTTRPCK